MEMFQLEFVCDWIIQFTDSDVRFDSFIPALVTKWNTF